MPNRRLTRIVSVIRSAAGTEPDTFSITATDAEKTPQSLSKSYTIIVSG
jgi:hypothetical protein